jgi:hypothetical protein
MVRTWGAKFWLAAILLAFAILYAIRPFAMGFYSDDWMMFLHPEPRSMRALHDYMAIYWNRPLSGFLSWPAQALINFSPARAQVVSIALTVVATASVGSLAYRLLDHFADGVRLQAALVAAAFFLCFPWSVGYTGWLTANLSAAFAAIFFCSSLVVLLRPQPTIVREGVSYMLMAASFLTYESFYGQFLIILLLAGLLKVGKFPKTLYARWILLFGLVNVACFIYNRLSTGNVKQFSWDGLTIFAKTYGSHLWGSLLPSIAGVALPLIVIFVVAHTAGTARLVEVFGARKAAAITMVVIGGILLAGFIYAMAGYPLITVGIFGRVTIALSLYAALGYGILAAAIFNAPGQLARFASVSLAALLVCFGTALFLRVSEWRDSWRLQLEVLNSLPASAKDLALERNKGVFLVIGEWPTKFVHLASAPWEISGAMAYAIYLRDPEAGRRELGQLWAGNQKWFAAAPNWSFVWDGASVTQQACPTLVKFERPADSLTVWRHGSDFIAAPRGFSLDCDQR